MDITSWPTLKSDWWYSLQPKMEKLYKVRKNKIQPVHPKGYQSWAFIGRTDVEAGTPILWPPKCEELTLLKRPWCWERLKAGEGDDRRWNGWMASLNQWTWVWVNSRSWWWQGGLACCSSWGCKESNTIEQLKWTKLNCVLATGLSDESHFPSKLLLAIICQINGFPGGSDSTESACNAGDPGLIPGLWRSSGEGNGNPFQYSCLENSMDRGAWWATVHGVSKSQIWLRNFHFQLLSVKTHIVCDFKIAI